MTDSSSNNNQPNILWIGVDQMRADALRCNGNPLCQTPTLDQLARDGVNFSRAYSPSSLCTPARASMFTGLYAFNHGREAIYLEFHGIRCLHTQRAWVSRDDFKYIFNPVDEDELYDLNNDPGELRNLGGEAAYQAEIKKMRRLLIEAADRVGDPVQNYAAKLFGDYTLLAAQPDVSAAYVTKP